MIVFAKRTWVLSLLLLLFAATPGWATTEFDVAVETLTVNAGENSVEVLIDSSAWVRYTYFELDGPRLVLDFHNAENQLGFSKRSVGMGGVQGVRAATFANGDVTRVVFDLDEKIPYEIADEGDGRVRVHFGDAQTRVSGASVALVEEEELAETAKAPAPVTASDVRDEVVAPREEAPTASIQVPELPAEEPTVAHVPVQDVDVSNPVKEETPAQPRTVSAGLEITPEVIEITSGVDEVPVEVIAVFEEPVEVVEAPDSPIVAEVVELSQDAPERPLPLDAAQEVWTQSDVTESVVETPAEVSESGTAEVEARPVPVVAESEGSRTEEATLAAAPAPESTVTVPAASEADFARIVPTTVQPPVPSPEPPVVVEIQPAQPAAGDLAATLSPNGIALAPESQTALAQTSSGLTIGPAVAAPPPPPPASPFLVETQVAPQETEYTGEIVSFNLVGSDIRDFFRVIAELSGLNIIIDDGVDGELTLVLVDVPWDQALDVVLRTNNLGYELQGNILRIAPQATLQAEEDALRALRDAQELNVPPETRAYVLSYTTAAEVLPLIQPTLTMRGSVINDARRNALIITEIPTRFERIESLIDFLDAPSQQVEIEARLLSATKSFSRELGSQFGMVVGNNSRGGVFGGVPTQPSPFDRTPVPQLNVDGTAMPLIADFPGAATSGFSFLIGVGGDVLLDEIITIGEENGTAKLLSRPRVVTQNNEPATVSQGTQIPVQTNVNNTITVTFIPFDLSLTVTPQITEAGTILLDAQIENSSPDFARAVLGVPSVSTQQAQTRVLIPDGGTAVIGGILLDQDSVNISQIPGLGDIPLIGNLFRSTSTAKSTSELIFFITARIRPSDPLEFLGGDDSALFESEGQLALQ